MDPPVSDLEKLQDEKEGPGPSFHCDLYDTQLVHKIAQSFLPGLATACVDNTTGDIFKSPGSVAADIRKEMIDYLTTRSETFVAEHIVLQGGGSENESSHDPYDIVSDFVDDFATSKRNLFSRVSGWLLSERREDNIDDFAQEMEINGFWLNDHREVIAQTLLRNVDFKNGSHCEMKFQSQRELAEHIASCGYRTMNCENEGCVAVFSANQVENHDSVCPFKIVTCEQNCSESIMRRDMDRHCITVCPMKLVNCPFRAVGCLSDVHQCELQRHCLDDVASHLMYVLHGIYKEASPNDLKPRAEQIQQLSSGLAEARNVRSLTNVVKEIDAKLGALEIKQGNDTDSESDKRENAEEKASEVEINAKTEIDSKLGPLEIKPKNDSDSESDERENAEKKASEVEINGKMEVASSPKQAAREALGDEVVSKEEVVKKAPEVVVMDKDKEEEDEEEEEESVETKQSTTNETRGLEIDVNEEKEKPTVTEDSSPTAMEKEEEDEEGRETVSSKAQASDEAEALSKSSEGFSKTQAETVPSFS